MYYDLGLTRKDEAKLVTAYTTTEADCSDSHPACNGIDAPDGARIDAGASWDKCNDGSGGAHAVWS